MRLQRIAFLLGVVVLAGFSVVFLRRSHHDSDLPLNQSPPAIPHPPSVHISSNAQQQKQEPESPAITPFPTDRHPIATLVGNAEQEFEQLYSRQSKTLTEAVNEYRRRYHMHPPPHFDKWFQFAQSRGVQLIDEYDTIYHSLLPFWAIEPKVIRERAREALGYDNAVIGVLIRKGKVTLVEGGGDGLKWQRDATVGMMSDFVEFLPDMDLVFNTHDEPRVVIPSDDLRRMVSIAKGSVLPKSFQNQSPKNAWSPRPKDLNKGDRIDEVRTTRFNRYAHQPTWTDSRASCPVDSPARSLNEDAPDNAVAYKRGDPGFIYNTTAFSDICNTPSLRNTYGFFDRPNAFDVVHDLFPIFSQSKISSFQDILYPSPWYWVNKVPYAEENDYPWDKKQEKMFWRGSTTGGFSRAGGWRRQHRQIFVGNINSVDNVRVLAKTTDGQWQTKEVSRADYRDLFDVKFTFIGQCDPNDCDAQREFFEVVDAVGQQDAWAYKYLVDIDGNAFSGRYYAFLHSNSLVCKVAIFREWHDEWIKPWVHYVPLSLVGDEYVETMRYFVTEDEGKNTAAKIAGQGRDWALKALRNDDMEVWFFRLLLEYGRLVDDNRESLGFFL
ncbi:hypothetical protein ALT_8554 [Aspergillus lentulus]|uniref:Glycosyl transferase CAP10 domain-containing protein n=1 Tax=Aspergillus lentulus TaxID=293939 RepID=A0AAN4PQN6_ASPLE|nr:hypothetical protein CNMCM6069_005217 [Aspergillus lentulus]KAF4169901.1 hypothetical protein CNMCM6936_006137 [Aspergillus lentulus]KAF4183134.1 hypothetical protein CNMCM8060_005161 [Aspergillus lentulus]KAF4190486.1 hypothetical protein CNMCM7927_003456 [Aspergillus lentulus]KAF4199449.1 hypothetical protein CNMCM8694_005122 [Aspergillus lentulus]